MNNIKILFQEPLICHSGRIFKTQSNSQYYFAFETVKNQEIVNQEIQIHYQLSSPYLKQIQSYIPDLNQDYILYSYKIGQTLHQLISKNVPFTQKQIISWIFSLIQALYHLHSNQLLGRCFSTQSIIIDVQTQNPTLMEFGFYPDILKENMRCTTAPEVVLKQFYDYKIDIWLLGVVCYELINLQSITNIKNENINEYIKWLQSKQSIKVSNSNYSKDLIDLVNQMLIFDSNDRIDFLTLVDNELFAQFDRNELITFYGQQFDIIKLDINEKIERELKQKQKYILKVSQQQQLIPSTNELRQSMQKIEEIVRQEPQSKESFYVNISYYQHNKLKNGNISYLEPPQIQNQNNFQQSDSYYEYFKKMLIEEFDTKLFPEEFHLYLPLYQLFILKRQVLECENLCANVKIVHLAQYYLTKVRVMYLRKLLTQLKKQESVNQIKNILKKEQSQIIKQYYEKAIKYVKELQENPTLQEVVQGITENVIEQNFEQQVKVAYRKVILMLYRNILYNIECNKQLDGQEVHQLVLFAYKTILCHLINRIFDPNLINQNFQQLKQDSITFEKIEYFIQTSSDIDKIKQMNSLISMYFS